MPERQNDVCGTNTAAAISKGTLRETVVIQLLGLAALALVAYLIVSRNYGALKYVVFMVPAVLIIPKPNFMPYMLILNFFAMPAFFQRGLIRLMVIDAVFVLFVMAFIPRQKNILGAALEKQRSLFTILFVFTLWAVVGCVFNFYGYAFQTNITSAFYIFNAAQLVAAVIIFSHPDWKGHREKIILFYIACTFLEICAALTMEVMSGARALKDFYKLTGTLGNHHGMLANILVLGAGVASAAFFQSKDRIKRHFYIIVCVSCVVLLLISGSRGALLGMFLAIPAVLFLNYCHKPSAWLVFALAVPAALAVFWLSPARGMLMGMFNFQNTSDPDMSFYVRILIWERVYEHMLYGPWIQKIVGLGIGAFHTLQFSYHVERHTFATGAHNNILHAFVETGIVGMIIFIAFFIEIIRKLVIMGKRNNDNSAKCFLMSTLTFLFSGLTQETFWFNPAYGRFWLQYLFCYLILFNFYDVRQKNKNASGHCAVSPHGAAF